MTFRTTEGQREAMIGCNQDGEVTGILESSARSEEGNLQSFVYSMISCLLKLEKSMCMYIYIVVSIGVKKVWKCMQQTINVRGVERRGGAYIVSFMCFIMSKSTYFSCKYLQ